MTICVAFDTETTDLLKAGRPLSEQPRITEIAAIKFQWLHNAETNQMHVMEVERLDEILFPGVPIPEKITQITGITNDMVMGKPTFAASLKKLQGFFCGVERLFAHNIEFDIGVLKCELERINKVTQFPWPATQSCTMAAARAKYGKLTKLGDMVKNITGEELTGAHRAMNDVEGMMRCIPKLIEEGVL